MFTPARTFVLALVAATLAMFASPVSASGEPSAQFGLDPLDSDASYFDITLQPGQSRELHLEIGNYGAAAGRARTYAADVFTLVNGGMGVRLRDEPPSGTTLWLSYAPLETELGPGEALQRSLNITVPADTPPGDYTTALVVENADPTGIGNSSGLALNQVRRHAIAVAINVPGDRSPALDLLSVESATVAGVPLLKLALANTGNLRMKPQGLLTLKDDNGRTVFETEIALDTVFPATTTLAEVPLPTVLEAGFYQLVTSFSVDGVPHEATVSFTITAEEVEESLNPPNSPDSPDETLQTSIAFGPEEPPLALAGLLLVALGLAVLLISRWRLHRNLSDAPSRQTFPLPDHWDTRSATGTNVIPRHLQSQFRGQRGSRTPQDPNS